MKKFIAVALFIAAIAALAGCNTSGAGKGDKPAEATTEGGRMEEGEVVPVELNASDYVELGKYKDLTVDVEKRKITDEDVQEEIDGTLKGSVDYKEIEGRDTVEKGDYLQIDYTAVIDGEKNEDYSADDYEVEVGEGDLDGNLGYGLGDSFKAEEKVIGSKIGEPVTIEFTFPKDYMDKDVAGKKCKMEILVKKIYEEITPSLEEYLKKYEEGKSVKDYTAEIRKELEDDANEAADGMANEKLWNQIVDNSKQKKDFTKEMIDQERENVLIDMQDIAEFYYGMAVEDFIKQEYNMTLDEYALYSLKSQCVQDLLLEAEDIKITDEDIKKEKEKLVKEEGYTDVNEVSENYTDEDLRSGLASERLFDKLLSYNKINVKETEAKDEDAAKDQVEETKKENVEEIKEEKTEEITETKK